MRAHEVLSTRQNARYSGPRREGNSPSVFTARVRGSNCKAPAGHGGKCDMRCMLSASQAPSPAAVRGGQATSLTCEPSTVRPLPEQTRSPEQAACPLCCRAKRRLQPPETAAVRFDVGPKPVRGVPLLAAARSGSMGPCGCRTLGVHGGQTRQFSWTPMTSASLSLLKSPDNRLTGPSASSSVPSLSRCPGSLSRTSSSSGAAFGRLVVNVVWFNRRNWL